MSDNTPATDLVPVHGGLDAPVDRTVPLPGRNALLAEAEGLSSIVISKADLSALYRIADGALSPMTGPMRKAAYDLSLDEKVIESRGKRYAWTIPIAFPLTDPEAAAIGWLENNGSQEFPLRTIDSTPTHLVSRPTTRSCLRLCRRPVSQRTAR